MSERDFHAALVKALDLSGHYGRNLYALRDTLGTGVERPLRLVWKDSALSRAAMGPRFDQLVEVLRQIERQDIEWKFEDRFELVLD